MYQTALAICCIGTKSDPGGGTAPCRAFSTPKEASQEASTTSRSGRFMGT